MNTIYEIGPFQLDTRARLLTRSGVPQPLGTRAAAVLGVLVEHANEPVLKSAILDAAWAGVVVEESNVAVQISAIRRVLAQAAGGDRWIETLARRGYRFVGPVKTASTAVSGAAADAGSHLPKQLTSFVGRDRECGQVTTMLGAQRLLTLVGAGGIGKTRLALRVAADIAPNYRDGVWFVDLAPIADPALVAGAIAQALHVSEANGKPVLETLSRRLGQRTMLIVLDNCEHVCAAAAASAEWLLKATAGITFLATSREPLRVAGEQVFPLPPMALPASAATTEAIAHSDAVRLFVVRAREQVPHFDLTPKNITGVAELCTHLDGIPLALELAAARVPALSIREINSRLDDRFRLLTGSRSNVLPRQQTLRATLDWSYDLLGEAERAMLRRLAVFAGEFTLDAATSVCASGVVEPSAVIDVLARLVDRSLVVANTESTGTRYRLLETTRAYAQDQLAEAYETAAAQRRHALYVCSLFEHAGLGSRMSDAQLDELYLRERDNVRAALDWTFGAEGDPRLGIALATSSAPMWAELSLESEGRRRLETAVAALTRDIPADLQALAWLRLAIAWGTASPARAVEAAEHAVASYRSLGDERRLGESLAWLGRIWVFMGRFGQAAPAFAEALALLERAGTPRSLASCLEGDGFLKMLTGDLASARSAFERTLSLLRNAGADRTAFGVLVNLGDLTWAMGDLDAALVQCREAVRAMRNAPVLAKELLGTCLTNLSGVLTERGELAEALVVGREGLLLRRESGHSWMPMDSLALRAGLAGKLESAARIVGHVNAAHRAKQSHRQPNEARAHARLMNMLHERFAEEDIARLLEAGAKLSTDEACRLAVED